jgi:protein tyrosine/serine phosphatase
MRSLSQKPFLACWFSRLSVLVALFAAQPGLAKSEPSIKRFEQVSFDLYRGAQPVGIEFKQLEDLGIRAVMSFVSKPAQVVEEERKQVEELGMKFFSFPMGAYVGPKKETLAAIFEELGREENWPIYIHCNNGRDRTGLITGLYRVHFDFWNADAAYREMKNKGYNPLLLGSTWKFWTYSHPGDLDELLNETRRSF